MFTIKDRAISPRKAQYEQAIKRLPQAHRVAQAAGISHLHHEVVQAAESVGLDSGPLKVAWHKNMAYLGIEHGKAGDALFDSEYGTAETGPAPVLRTAATRAHPVANAIYHHVLRKELGV